MLSKSRNVISHHLSANKLKEILVTFFPKKVQLRDLSHIFKTDQFT